jgi:hypothetical protein
MPLVQQLAQDGKSTRWTARCDACDRWYTLAHARPEHTLLYLLQQGWDWHHKDGYTGHPDPDRIVIICPACHLNGTGPTPGASS